MTPVLIAPDADDAARARPIHICTRKTLEATLSKLDPVGRAFADAHGFSGKAGELLHYPDSSGAVAGAVFGLGDNSDPRTPVALGAGLRPWPYEVRSGLDEAGAARLVAMFVDGAYRFTRYKNGEDAAPRLKIPAGMDAAAEIRLAEAANLARDLVNTPAEDMGPDGIEAAIREIAEPHGAEIVRTIGPELLEQNYPMIHAVGRAGQRAPRLIEMSWGTPTDPVLAIVGKGVCFDTGGLNIKGGDYMRDMKKDMGGAAHAIALAKLVMDAGLPVRLHLLVPAVENNVSANSFRPGDVYPTRKGLKIEIDNTDAEGRLVLSDALTRAGEHSPDLMIDFATLTGAARVALGADLAPFYTPSNDLASALDIGGYAASDPVWRMPLWSPYLSDLKSSIADMQNSGGRLAGSITAALFLNAFVDMQNWVHFDVWAWREARYGRPAGAATCGLRASWDMLRRRYS